MRKFIIAFIICSLSVPVMAHSHNRKKIKNLIEKVKKSKEVCS